MNCLQLQPSDHLCVGIRKSSPQRLALAGVGHREGIRHTMKAYLSTQAPQLARERDQDVATTAGLHVNILSLRKLLVSQAGSLILARLVSQAYFQV